jgi:rare lipoprotein A
MQHRHSSGHLGRRQLCSAGKGPINREDRLTLSNWRINAGAARIAICLCLVVSLAGCSTQTGVRRQSVLGPTVPPLRRPQPPETGSKRSKTVTASYQSSGTAGHATASGESYNPNDLTAASRTLPMGSTVKVTNPETGRSVKVRINDRGPFVHGRSLDLSKSAAQKIGITQKGVARVKVAPVDSNPVSGEPESPSAVSKPASLESD